jgi:hypothetical protein
VGVGRPTKTAVLCSLARRSLSALLGPVCTDNRDAIAAVEEEPHSGDPTNDDDKAVLPSENEKWDVSGNNNNNYIEEEEGNNNKNNNMGFDDAIM